MLFSGLIAFLLLIGRSEASVKVYPRIAPATSRDRILIVAPHIDDEAIGAAGYAADAVANGADVYVVFLTAGDCNKFSARLLHRTLGPTASNYLSVGRVRIAEAHDAMRLLGVPADHYFVLGYPDRGLRAMVDHRTEIVRSIATRETTVPYAEAMSPGLPYSFTSVMSDMSKVMERARPTIVIAPVHFDLHSDHSAASDIADLAIAASATHPYRLGYLVHSSRVPMSLVRLPERALVPPARMRSLDWATYPLSLPVQKKKDELLSSYKSQRPYTAILRNAFVRTNELFYIYRSAGQTVVPPSAGVVEGARLPIAR